MTILRMAFQKLDLEKLIPLTSRKTCEVKCLLHAFQFVTFNFRFGSTAGFSIRAGAAMLGCSTYSNSLE